MCNYCYNSIRALGSKTAVGHLHKVITNLLKNKNAGVYELLAAHNYTEKELEDVYRRDYISYCERKIEFDKIRKQYYFDFYTESAWGPNLEMLFKLVKEKYLPRYSLLAWTDIRNLCVWIARKRLWLLNSVIFNDKKLCLKFYFSKLKKS